MTLPAIPQITDETILMALEALKEIVEIRNQMRPADPLDRFITARELDDSQDLTWPTGTNTGDIIRYDAVTGTWESSAEPLTFTQINLTPAAAAHEDTEGGLWYKSTDNGLYVGTE